MKLSYFFHIILSAIISSDVTLTSVLIMSFPIITTSLKANLKAKWVVKKEFYLPSPKGTKLK